MIQILRYIVNQRPIVARKFEVTQQMGALADNLSIPELSGQKQPRRSQELSQELINVARENQHRSKSVWISRKTTLLRAQRW